MAKQRVQVAKLNAPTQANLQGGTAPVVETMRVLAPDQTPETPLSQFVSAIAPAMEADAADRRIKRLKREQEIQNGIRAKKENQLEQARISLIGDLTLEYAKNETTNLDMGEAAYLEKRQKAYAPYLDKLRSTDLEPELIDALEGDLALADVTFMKTKYAPSKVQRNYDQLDEGFKNTLLLINQQVQDGGLTLEGGVEQIAAVRQSFLEAHPERYDDAKINDEMVKLADIDTADPNRVNSPLVSYLAGTESKNQLNVERNREVGAKIAARQAAAAKTNKSALQKVAASKYAENLAKLAIDGDFKNLNFDTDTTATIDGITFTKKFGKADILVHIEGMAAAEIEALQSKPAEGEQAVAIKEAVIASAKRRHFAAYAAVGGKPPEVSAALRDAKAIWQGDMNQFDMIAGEKVFGNLMIAEKSFNQLAEVEDYLGSEGISQMFEGDKKSLEMYRTIKSAMQANKTFKEAIDMAQRFDIDTTPKINITTDDLSAEIDPSGPTGWFTFTNLEETANLSVLSTDAENLARIKKSTNPLISEEDAKSSAIKEVAADYRAMTMPDGTLMAIKAESGSHQELQLNAAEQALKDAMQNKEFVDAVSKMYNYSPRLVPTSVLGVESMKQVGGFSLLVQNNPTNANQLQVYAVGTGSQGKISTTAAQYPLGTIDLTTIATQQKFKFIDDAIGNYQQTVAPIVESTPEDDIELNYTPTVTKPLVEMTFDDFMETDTAKDIKKAFSLDNDILQTMWKANVELGKGMVDFGGDALDLGGELLNNVFGSTEAGAAETGTGSLSLYKGTGTIPKEWGTSTETITTNMLIAEEQGDLPFQSKPYKDGADQSIGYGFYLKSLEPDELALIANKDKSGKPISITKAEADKILAIKQKKIGTKLSQKVKGFNTFTPAQQASLIGMSYQLGIDNVFSKFPKFSKSLQTAAKLPVNSEQRKEEILTAVDHMLYNYDEKGNMTGETAWHKQTPQRVYRMAKLLMSQ